MLIGNCTLGRTCGIRLKRPQSYVSATFVFPFSVLFSSMLRCIRIRNFPAFLPVLHQNSTISLFLRWTIAKSLFAPNLVYPTGFIACCLFASTIYINSLIRLFAVLINGTGVVLLSVFRSFVLSDFLTGASISLSVSRYALQRTTIKMHFA